MPYAEILYYFILVLLESTFRQWFLAQTVFQNRFYITKICSLLNFNEFYVIRILISNSYTKILEIEFPEIVRKMAFNKILIIRKI